MKLNLKFKENSQKFDLKFGQVQMVSDGGYERGYGEGYAKGEIDGFQKGYDEGLSKREYEIWTITYIDGTIEEVKVALV
jgi:flagellar biosynthesis/type III secretory pathway protein FliH